MSILTTIAHAFLDGLPERTLTSFPSVEEQAERVGRRSAGAHSWKRKSVTQALGVPSILSAVSLISGTVGRLSLDGYQNGTQILDRTKIPQLMIRPLPGKTPREFFLRTAFYQATRGEFWWYVAHRDGDGNADALFPVPPWEITVQSNPSDRLNPTIMWLGRTIPNADMRHQVYLPDQNDPAGVRGIGPLQLAGAAVSVAVEADAWAGNFFSGKLPSLIGATDMELDENDLKALDEQWKEKDSNLPRWTWNGLKFIEPPYNAQKAQLTESRAFQVGEVARMFDMPGPLLEYQMSGQSLTYRNGSDIWTQFQQQCLSPHYLEPMQQEMSDLLVRSVTAVFNTWELTKADQLTRFQVYESGVTRSGVLTVDEARRMEGLAPGDVNYLPVPQSPPSADPGQIPMNLSETRCPNCKRMLGKYAGAFETKCPKCGTLVSGDGPQTFSGPVQQIAQPSPVYILNVTPAPASPQVTVTSEVAPPDMEGVKQLAEAFMAYAQREQPTPQVNVTAPVTIEAPKPRLLRRKVERDEQGLITLTTEEEVSNG